MLVKVNHMNGKIYSIVYLFLYFKKILLQILPVSFVQYTRIQAIKLFIFGPII